MKVLYDLKDKIEEELKILSKKEQLTKDEVCLIGEMVDIIKDISTIEAMKKAELEGWSNSYAYDDYSNTYGNVYARRSRDEGAYARGRDSMGRYTSRDGSYARNSYEDNSYASRGSYEDGYSRHSKEDMINDLKAMMIDARTPEERESYRSMIDKLSR